MSKIGAIPGASTAQRTLRILKLIGEHAEGLSAQQIRELLGEERSAVQRALHALLAENLIQKGPNQRRFFLGTAAIQLGQSALNQSPLVAKYQFALQHLARITGDTVFLSVRIGDFSYCVYRAAGEFSVRASPAREGDIWVLGTNAGGFSLLASQPPAEIRRIYDRYQAAFSRAKMSLPAIWREVDQVRKHGYAVISNAVTEGVTSLGLPLGNPKAPFASAVIAASQARMGNGRAQRLYELLRQTLQ